MSAAISHNLTARKIVEIAWRYGIHGRDVSKYDIKQAIRYHDTFGKTAADYLDMYVADDVATMRADSLAAQDFEDRAYGRGA